MTTQHHVENPLPPIRHPYSLMEVTAHIDRGNIITKSAESMRGRKCGDGRDEQNFVEAIFGSDLGYAFAAQAALRDLEKITPGKEGEAFATTLSLVAGDGGMTFVHTDDHHGNEGQLFGGCGANRVARNNMQGFGLTIDDFQALDKEMENLNTQGKVEKDVYRGDHIEGAVVLVRGRSHGIKAYDERENTSVFVVTVDLIEDRFHSLAKALAQQHGIDEKILYEKMYERWSTQTEIIRLNLAKIGDDLLPVFTATFDRAGLKVLQAN